MRKAMLREAFGKEIPLREAEKIADAVARIRETAAEPPARRKRIRYNARCVFVMEDGKKCKQSGWLGGEFCFQHDPEAAELRKLAGRPSKERLTKGEEVEELLDETLTELQEGRMKPGQAYATGYLAQLMLMARETRRREVKLDVKWFREMVDLIVNLDDAQKSLKEKKRKAREEKKKKKAREARKAASLVGQGGTQDKSLASPGEEANEAEGEASETGSINQRLNE